MRSIRNPAHAVRLCARAMLAVISLAIVAPIPAQAALQCVPYARQVSGIQIYGNASTWWDQANGRYARGDAPTVGAVLAFEPTSSMPFGHVAVVTKIIDDRHILLDHANWSGPGVIDRAALAVDVSEAGDWSSVRVWYDPSDSLGSRENPTFGFIYAFSTGEARLDTSLASDGPAPDRAAGLWQSIIRHQPA